jgi:hypothetical protein
MSNSFLREYESGERKGNVQHLTDLRSEKRDGKMPPQSVLDRIADQKLSGGYKRIRNGQSNVCGECFETKSVNGSCGC